MTTQRTHEDLPTQARVFLFAHLHARGIHVVDVDDGGCAQLFRWLARDIEDAEDKRNR